MWEYSKKRVKLRIDKPFNLTCMKRNREKNSITKVSSKKQFLSSAPGRVCNLSSTQTITIGQLPDASIDDFNDYFTSCGSSNFNEQLIGNWLGDGSAIFSQSTLPLTSKSHNYTSQGYFNLELTITNLGQLHCAELFVKQTFIPLGSCKLDVPCSCNLPSNT